MPLHRFHNPPPAPPRLRKPEPILEPRVVPILVPEKLGRFRVNFDALPGRGDTSCSSLPVPLGPPRVLGPPKEGTTGGERSRTSGERAIKVLAHPPVASPRPLLTSRGISGLVADTSREPPPQEKTHPKVSAWQLAAFLPPLPTFHQVHFSACGADSSLRSRLAAAGMRKPSGEVHRAARFPDMMCIRTTAALNQWHRTAKAKIFQPLLSH